MNRWVAVLAVGLALVAVGCGGNVDNLSFPTPPTTPAPAPSPPTLPSNLASVGQAVVPGVTTTTLPPIGPGQASLNGTVFGPAGPVPGATVEADRIVGDEVTATKTTTAADGSWTIPNILGGRFRVRAWQSPSLALTSPQLVFVGSNQALSMSLQLAQYTGPDLAASVSPADPETSQTSDLLVQVTNPTVGADGIVRNPPEAGAAVTLVDGPSWLVENGNPLTTNAKGDVLFQISCTTAGSDPLSATVGSGVAVPLQVPPCTAAPTPASVPPPACQTLAPPPTVPGEVTTTSTTLVFGDCP